MRLDANWPAPVAVKAFTTYRTGGYSPANYTSLNLALHVNDDVNNVKLNRQSLTTALDLPSDPVWLDQVHGAQLVELSVAEQSINLQADGAVTQQKDKVCAVLTADCLPVLLCNKQGTQVAAVHAGWRGLLGGVIENAVAMFEKPDDVLAWLGPAIGPAHFEVGREVKDAFTDKKPVMQQAFRYVDKTHCLADLYALARMTLLDCGVKKMYGGEHCTYNESDKFYSYRREPITGRMASLIWLQP